MCDLCRDTGKLPLKNYTHGFYNCSCSPQEYGTFKERQSVDFDFPCSDTFRGFYQEEQRTRQVLPIVPVESVVVHRHSTMSKQESELLQQTAGKLEHVSKTLSEHLNFKKNRYGAYENA